MDAVTRQTLLNSGYNAETVDDPLVVPKADDWLYCVQQAEGLLPVPPPPWNVQPPLQHVPPPLQHVPSPLQHVTQQIQDEVQRTPRQDDEEGGSRSQKRSKHVETGDWDLLDKLRTRPIGARFPRSVSKPSLKSSAKFPPVVAPPALFPDHVPSDLSQASSSSSAVSSRRHGPAVERPVTVFGGGSSEPELETRRRTKRLRKV